MTNREADHIVHDLQGMRSTSDFTGVATEIQDLQKHDPEHFQRNLAQINKSVDMKALGFPSDFKLAGVNDQKQLVTVSEDGKSVEARDPHNMSTVESSKQAASSGSPTHMGSREVTINPVDGSNEYTSKKGDSLWSIARDSISQPGGQRPSNAAVEAQVKHIAKENNITDPNKLMVGTELRIPNRADHSSDAPIQPVQTNQRPDRPKGPYTPNAPADSAAVQPKDGVSNPVAVPGLANDGDPAVASRTPGVTERLPNGTTIESTTGKLNDGWITDTKFTAQRTTDEHGNLVHSVINYDGSGADLKLSTPTGEQTVPHVNKVETNFNARTGRYDTTLSTADGGRYHAVTGKDGRVVSYVQDQAPSGS